MTPYDAVVIGGGPAGATAALLLARAGWSVAVLERAPYPRGKVCGEYLSAAALGLLHDLGIADIARDAGPEVRRVALWAGAVQAAAAMPRHDDARAPYGRALAREACDARLLQHAVAAGAALWQPCRALRLHGASGAFECEAESGGVRHVVHARCVIAAHGSWEAGGLPTQALRRAPLPGDLLGFKTYFRGVALEPGLLPLTVFPGGYAGLVHTTGARVNLACCVRRDVLAACRRRHPGLSAGDALLAHLQAENRAARFALGSAERVAPWLGCGPLKPGIGLRGREGLYVIGNAAGEAHPLIGEGLAMAMQSAVLLAGALREAGQGGWAEAARRYEREWRRLFAPRRIAGACYARIAMRPGAARAAAALLSRAPRLLTLGARWSGRTRPP